MYAIECVLFQKQCNEELNDFQTFQSFYDMDMFFSPGTKGE